MEMELFKYLDYAVGIAGIIGIIIVVRIFVKFIGNHIESSTKANQKLSDAIEQMLRFLERNK